MTHKSPFTATNAKFPPIACLLALVSVASAVDVGIDALIMGASRHSDRTYPWKECNQGAGVSPFVQWTNAELFLSMGQFKNSTGGTSFFEMVGGRYVQDFGDWTAGAWGSYGVLTGYAGEAIRPMAGVSVGWRWIYLDTAYRPATSNSVDIPETAVLCAWLRIRAITF